MEESAIGMREQIVKVKVGVCGRLPMKPVVQILENYMRRDLISFV